MRANGLVNGTFELGGETVDLKAITRPVLNIMAERDHIVPLAAAEPLLGLVGSHEKEELRLAAGHAGLVAGRKAAKVTLPGIAGWFKEHSRGDLMEIRAPSDADLDALHRLLRARPRVRAHVLQGARARPRHASRAG